MSLFALKRELFVSKRHHVAHGISFTPAPFTSQFMTPAMACFLAIDISAIENYIFTSKQSFNAKYASRVVSVLITIPDPAMEQGLAWMTSLQSFLVLRFAI